ncbi:MAG: M1 family peptidase, partial [Maribacter dokdonensis]
ILANPKFSLQLKLALISLRNDFSALELPVLITSDNVKVRQFAAEKMGKIHESLKEDAEALLLDDSYVTNEIMLYNLWSSFEQDRVMYLEETKDVVGLPNKNFRQLWLTLALFTPEYKPTEKVYFHRELVGYTSAVYNPEIRQTAFQYLSEINALNDEALVNLIKATNHHSWQFRNYARLLLDRLWENDEQKKEIEKVANQLNSADLRYLKTKLK